MTKRDRLGSLLTTGLALLFCYSLVWYGMRSDDHGALVIGAVAATIVVVATAMTWNGKE